MGRKQEIPFEIVNPHAAGIDVGSRSHYVAIGQHPKDVKEFGVYSTDHTDLVKWLRKNNIKTIAMESTGTYWQNLFSALQDSGFEVLLANGKFTKNIKGKKTDVLDCQWIQKLHSLGLLSGSFLPDIETEYLRTYCRHRQDLMDQAASTSAKMQKYLRLMNIRLDVVVKDVCGLTGLRIIEAICSGEIDSDYLSRLRHGNCKKSASEIAMALKSNDRQDYLFALRHELQIYHETQTKIEECEQAIKAYLEELFIRYPNKQKLTTSDKVHKRVNKNAPKAFDLNQVSYKFFAGIDLMNIEGVSHSTILTLMSEIGPEGLKRFPTAKHFASWLRLAPNNRVSGYKILSSRIPRGSNRLKTALRQAANAIGNMKNANLYRFFVRISVRKGRAAAITATARKLAMIIWNMIVKKVPYSPPNPYEFLDQKRKRKVREMQNIIRKFNIWPQELGLAKC